MTGRVPGNFNDGAGECNLRFHLSDSKIGNNQVVLWNRKPSDGAESCACEDCLGRVRDSMIRSASPAQNELRKPESVV